MDGWLVVKLHGTSDGEKMNFFKICRVGFNLYRYENIFPQKLTLGAFFFSCNLLCSILIKYGD